MTGSETVRIVLVHARRTINYINGVSPATARKIGKFFFKEKFITLKENGLTSTFDLYIKEEKELDKKESQNKMVKEFKYYWGANWKIYYYSEQE